MLIHWLCQNSFPSATLSLKLRERVRRGGGGRERWFRDCTVVRLGFPFLAARCLLSLDLTTSACGALVRGWGSSFVAARPGPLHLLLVPFSSGLISLCLWCTGIRLCHSCVRSCTVSRSTRVFWSDPQSPRLWCLKGSWLDPFLSGPILSSGLLHPGRDLFSLCLWCTGILPHRCLPRSMDELP